MESRCLIAVILIISCCFAAARPLSPIGSYKQMPVPCVMKYYNSFCYLEKNQEACTFYSSPSFATYKECAASTNMGKTLKCSEVSAEEKKTDRYANCLDAEPKGVTPVLTTTWKVKENVDIKGMDIACDGKNFCQVCKSVNEIKARCLKTKGCVSFAFDGKCGFLKTAGSRSLWDRKGWKVITTN